MHSNDRKGKRDFCDTPVSVSTPSARYEDGRKECNFRKQETFPQPI